MTIGRDGLIVAVSRLAAFKLVYIDADYQRLLCVETTNAANDIVEVAPGGECRLTANYRVIRN